MSFEDSPLAAGNGLLDRRYLLKAGVAGSAALLTASAGAGQRQAWMQGEGAAMSGSGSPSRHETPLTRLGIASQPGTAGSGASRAPLEHLDGLITPRRLHFERHHSGIPDIDPDQHSLAIHGLVERPLQFSMQALLRYPMVSRIQFLECSGNSGVLVAPQPVPGTCGSLHGLVSSSEWGGVPLSILLDEAGIKPQARWVVAEGADAAAMNRSVPISKMLDDAIVALYQNGERLMPANGYPMRLFLPGWEGNASVKWLRSLQLTEQPAMSREETSKYSDLQADGRAQLFTFQMGVKSVISNPSPGLGMGPPGIYQISGLAWSGAGRIAGVEVSTDGGGSWAPALLDQHVLPKSLTRFRAPWNWNGAAATIMSRATDETGAIQPTRNEIMRNRAARAFYHYNGIQAWRLNKDGSLENVYV